MLHAFTTQDVLELLVNSFNAAAKSTSVFQPKSDLGGRNKRKIKEDNEGGR